MINPEFWHKKKEKTFTQRKKRMIKNLHSNAEKPVFGRIIILILLVIYPFHLKTLFAQEVEPHLQWPEILPDQITNIKTSYGAVGDGVTDDTEAINKALKENRRLYLPEGTYLVSNTIHWGDKKTSLYGAGKDRTIIKLADNTPGFSNWADPKIIVNTNRFEHEVQDQDNFGNRIKHLTIDAGSNAGAIALSFHSSNIGIVENVNIRGNGYMGLDCTSKLPGPFTVKDLLIDGFVYGIKVKWNVHSVIFKNVTVKNAHIGLENEDNICSIWNFNAINCREGIVNKSATGTKKAFISVYNSSIKGKGSGTAITNSNQNSLLLYNVETSAFDFGVISDRDTVSSGYIHQWTSEKPLVLWPSPDSMLNLAYEETPQIQYPTPDESVIISIPSGGYDISDTLQKIIDSSSITGITTIFLEHGSKFTKPVYIRENIQRIMGLGNAYMQYKTNDRPVFVIEDGNSPVVVFESLMEEYGGNQSYIFSQSATRSLVINSSSCSYRNTVPDCKVYMEDVGGYPFVFRNMKAWITGINTESVNQTHIINQNSDVWILGHKTEKDQVNILTKDNGRTELLGGLFYSNSGNNDNTPSIIIKDASMSFSVRYEAAGNYEYFVEEWRNGRKLMLPGNAEGRITLFNGYPLPDDTTQLGVPPNLRAEAVNETTIKLRWDLNNESCLNHYNIYRDTVPDYTPTSSYRIASGLMQNYEDKQLSAGVRYYYKVAAVDSAYRQGPAASVSENTLVDTIPPSSPVNLFIECIDSTSLAIKWTGGEEHDIKGYILYRDTNPSFTAEEKYVIDTVRIPSYFDQGLQENTKYYYLLKSFDSSGNISENSERVSGSTEKIDYNYPLKIDFGASQQNVQPGFIEWTGSNVEETKEFSTAFDTAFAITLTNVDWRIRGNQDVSSSVLYPKLIEDGIKSASIFSLGFQNLDPGTYAIKTFHHDANEADGSLDIFVSDKNGEHKSIEKLPQSGGISPSIVANAFFMFDANGEDNVIISIEDNNDGGYNEAFLNGILLDKLSYPAEKPVLETVSSEITDPSLFIDLSWENQHLYTDGFVIERRQEGKVFQSIDTVHSVVNSYRDTLDLHYSTVYDYRIKGLNLTHSNSFWSDLSKAITPGPPESPSNLNCTTLAFDTIYLSWKDNAVTESGYIIERKSLSEPFERIDTLEKNSTTYKDVNLQSKTRYLYRVYSINNLGQSEYSNIGVATTFDLPPENPRLINAHVNGQKALLSWEDKSDNELGFKIIRHFQGQWDLVKTVNPDESYWEDENLLSDVEYQYAVCSYNYGYESFSDTIKIHTMNPPERLTIEFLPGNTIELQWADMSENEWGYIIERRDTADYRAIDSINSIENNSYIDTTLNSDLLYYYRVRAYNGSGISTYSNSVSTFMMNNSETLTNKGIKIFPNPSPGRIYYELPETTEGASLKIYSGNGGLLFEKNKISARGEIDLSAYPKGVYFLLVKTESNKRMHKLILVE